MNRDCREVRESLAAGEAAEPRHLEGCPGCAAFARDLAWLRTEAAGLPRPPLPIGPRAAAAARPRGGHRALLALASAATIALAAGLVLRDHARSVPPSRALDAGAPSAAREEALDLLGTLAEARRVYAPVTSGARGWHALPSTIEIDPLASLRPAALLIEDETTNPRRKR